uniref:ubiquitinyl hydrolase 1 n=1 Tax=Erpetoichthys calabaricus TaxID=27687 RepID=A0A8C4TF95_ERPCA
MEKAPRSRTPPTKARKLLRKKPLRSVGSFVSRILRTLSTLSRLGEHENPEPEDDDGGFRDGPCGDVAPGPATHGHTRERFALSPTDKTPGVLGLKNHGNTCFMNAVVQCLSNTDLFAEYLGLERYKLDLRPQRAEHGEVTDQLASLVRALWTLEYTPQLSVDFKNIVSKYGSQFKGNSQHDALEFLLWLLDKVHEDITSAPSSISKMRQPGKALVTVDESPGDGQLPPDGSHSFVQNHFQAQYRSSLTCPHCHKQSNTFDPFLCISLPIPLRQTRPVYVTLVFLNKGQRYLRIGLAVPLFGSVACLREMVANEGKVTPDQVILTELYSTGFQRSFSDDEDLTSIAENDSVYAFQAPTLLNRNASHVSGYHHSLPSSPYSSGQNGHKLPHSGTLSSEFLHQGMLGKVLLLICSTTGTGQQSVRFGPPFLMREDRAISWEQLQQCILSKMCYLMIGDAQTQNFGALFRIRVVGGSSTFNHLSPQDAHPLYHPAVERALKFCGPGGPPHVKLIIEWDDKAKECLFGNIQEEVVHDDDSVRVQQQQHQQQHSCSLDECFQLYTKEEQLAPDDAWRCPHCKKLQQGTVKLSLWTLPDILILHLKRFRQVGERRNKLSTLVRFPFNGLDMAPHVVKRSHSTRNLLSPWPQWKQTAPDGSQHQQDFLYDLYAVCNHHGGLHGGHYTAFCRNSVDAQWYSYDDSSVELIPQEEVCTRGPTFFSTKKRNIIPQWSASSSLRGSTSSSVSDHWLVRLNQDSKRASLVSRVSTNCASSPESPVFLEVSHKEEKGGFETRPIVRGIQGRSVSLKMPTKMKAGMTKSLPLRWSFGAKDQPKPVPGELVEYLESGRRPRCTTDSIVPLMTLNNDESRIYAEELQPRSRSPLKEPTISCLGKTSRETVLEDQKKMQLENEKRGSLKKNRKIKDNDTLTRRTSKKNKEGDLNTSSTGNGRKSSNSESTLKKNKLGKGEWDDPNPPEVTKGKKSEDGKPQEGKFTFFKNSFLRKNSKKPKEAVVSRSTEMINGPSMATLPNGGHSKMPSGMLKNSSSAGHPVTDIKRSQSSSNIQSKTDSTLRRTASLHRNGLLHPPPRAGCTEKVTYDTLQKMRHSTASLNSKKSVPESSF